MRKIIGILLLAVCATALPALAANALNPGVSLQRPGETPDLGAPYYSNNALPSYFILANQVATLTSSWVLGSGTLDGNVTSIAYKNPTTGFLGFEYIFSRKGSVGSNSQMVRASLGGGANAFMDADIFDAGSDSNGLSTAGSGAPDWTDGAPDFIQRDTAAAFEGIAFQFRANNQGSAIGVGNYSADIFIQTQSLQVTQTGVGFIDSGATSSATVLAPIPEPMTVSLLVAGGVVFLLRRRRGASARV
jgi:hypothetical protein